MRTKEYRNSNLFLRNEFESSGVWGFPFIKKQTIDLDQVELIACSDTSMQDVHNLHKGVHFFTDDYRFESVYAHPDKSFQKLCRYKFLLTPDYSLYSEMKPWRQIESVGKARWVGAYWQNQGAIVIPTISWAQPTSFGFCFDAIEKHSIVAIGMIGCKHERVAFMKGYNAMLDALEPTAIICFGEPFPEMEGRIIAVDYLSSRKVVRHGR